MEQRARRQIHKETPSPLPISMQSVFTNPDFDPKRIAKDPVDRVFAVSDAATIFAVEQIVHGVPFEDAERIARQIRDCGRGRRSIVATLENAKTIFNPGGKA